MNATVVDHPEDQPTPSDLQLRRPDIPVTLSELAAHKGEAIEIVEARVTILQHLRKAAILATSPEDWVLFKAPDEQGGQVVGYLQDAGADRVRDIYGIEIFDVSAPEKISSNTDPGSFHYIIRGSGRCKLTRQILEQVEGGRSSTDDFCRGKRGVELELLVRKAARANLDGNITRELAGLKSVPLEDIKAAWSESRTPKDWQRCRRGRGFGSGVERQGQRAVQEGETKEAPKCEVCGAQAQFKPGGTTNTGKKYDAFWSCPNSRQQHPDRKWTLDDSKWREQLDARAKAAQPAAPAPATNGTAKAAPAREPGQEG